MTPRRKPPGIRKPPASLRQAARGRVADLPARFVQAWQALAPQGLPAPIREHRFHPVRRWRFDLAFIDHRVAVEIDGATWTQGRHTRGSGFILDCEKLNTAAAMGWRVLRFPSTVLNSRPADCVALVQQAIGGGR